MVLTALLLLIMLWFAVDVLLLVFGGILFAILLHSLSAWVGEHTGLSGVLSLAVVVLGLAGLLSLGIWRLAPEVAGQLDQLNRRLPSAIQHLRRQLEDV